MQLVCENCQTNFEVRPRTGTRATYQFCSRACHAASRRSPKTIIRRFWSKVERGDPDACWLWKGSTTKEGYGCFAYVREPGKVIRVLAHVFAYKIRRGKISAGLCVCHHCDTPGCCNPGHLFPGTHAQNSADMVAKERQLQGEQAPMAVLRESDIREIRRLRELGATQQSLADVFGVCQPHISDIVRGLSWRKVA